MRSALPRTKVTAGPRAGIVRSAFVAWLGACLLPSSPARTWANPTPWNTVGADSSNVTILGFYPVNSALGIWDCAGFVAEDGHEFGLIGGDSLHVVDLADPSHPKRAAALPAPVPSYYVHLAVRGVYAYAALRHGPIVIVDLTDPEAPLVAGQIPQNQFCACSCGHPCTNPTQAEIETIFIDERGYLYVSGIRCGEGVHIFNLNVSPTAPQWMCHEHTFTGPGRSFYAHDTEVRNGLMYVSRSQGRPDGDPLPRWDILDANPPCGAFPGSCGGERPAWITSFRHAGPELHSHSATPLDAPGWLATCDEKTNGHVRIWDVANLAQPVQVSEIHPDATCHSVHNVYSRGDFLYAAWYNKGIQVYCLSDPTAPFRCGYYEHPLRWHSAPADTCCDPTEREHAGCYGVPHLDTSLPSGLFLGSEVDGGLLVGKFALPAVGVDPGTDDEGGRKDESSSERNASEARLVVTSPPGVLPVRLLWRPGRVDDATTAPPLAIHDSAGRRRVTIQPRQRLGTRVWSYEWDGRDDGGVLLAAGLYFARVVSERRGEAEIAAASMAGAKIVLLP